MPDGMGSRLTSKMILIHYKNRIESIRSRIDRLKDKYRWESTIDLENWLPIDVREYDKLTKEKTKIEQLDRDHRDRLRDLSQPF